MKNKRTLFIAAIIVLALLPTVASARWALVTTAASSMSFSNGRASVAVDIFANSSVNSMSAVVYLDEQQPGGYYTQVYKWPTAIVSGNRLNFSGSCPAIPGKTYRLYADVTASSGSQSESISFYTQKTY